MSLTRPPQFAEVRAGQAPASAAAFRNPWIQSLRGVAALFVTLYHASYDVYLLGDAGWAPVFDGRFGLIGVAIFFAISGMLMAELIQRTDPWQFLAHRIVRIYPTFLLAVLVSAPLLSFVGGFGLAFHGLSLLLVPAGVRPYYLGVEWTLVFECTYYVALFMIAVAGWRRYLNWIALTWLAAIFAAPLFVGWNDNVFCYFYSLWLVPSDAAFAGGLLIPWIGRNVRIPVGAGILACLVLMAAPPANPVVAHWAAGVAATLLVLDAIRIKRPPLPGLHKLGDWSYALYLVHASTIWIVYHFWPTAAGAGLALLFAVATALLVAASFGMLDVWLHRYLKNMVDALGKDDRRRRVNIYAGVFILASLIAAFVA